MSRLADEAELRVRVSQLPRCGWTLAQLDSMNNERLNPVLIGVMLGAGLHKLLAPVLLRTEGLVDYSGLLGEAVGRPGAITAAKLRPLGQVRPLVFGVLLGSMLVGRLPGLRLELRDTEAGLVGQLVGEEVLAWAVLHP